MFVREHHRDIALVLSNLDASLFRAHHCYFGDGTAIVLLNNEFRESVDIDFLVSDSESFRDLRLMAKAGFDNFFRTGAARIKPLRDVKIDQYGIHAQLSSAIERLRLNPTILERSISALGIQVPQALLWQRIKALGKLVERAYQAV